MMIRFVSVLTSSGEEALVEVGKNIAGFGLIFLDMVCIISIFYVVLSVFMFSHAFSICIQNMTGITGVETTRALRALGCNTPIVGLTGMF